MIDVETLIRDELAARVPLAQAEAARWDDVLRRSGETARRRRRRNVAVAATVAILGVVLTGTLGGAVIRAAGGFAGWLTGTPGEPVTGDAQDRFERAGRFPGKPQLHELLQTELDGRVFYLYGFATKQVVCLRVALRAHEGAEAACVSRGDLRRSRDLVIPMRANVTIGHVGKTQRRITTPRYLLTFGLAADDVERVTVRYDVGESEAVTANGAFLHVFRPGERGRWAREVIARTARARDVVPLAVEVSGQPPLRTGLRPHGPAAVERVVRRGTIGWFLRREDRGLSASDAGLHLDAPADAFVRVVEPDRDDLLQIVVSDTPLFMERMPLPAVPAGEHRLCWGVVTRGGVGTGCGTLEQMFREGPMALSWGFSGGGQQMWMVDGLVSDDVARLEVFLGDGTRSSAPLRDNATVFRVPRVKFPARVVAYDSAGRVIDVQTLRGG